jgi:hypothetical protein
MIISSTIAFCGGMATMMAASSCDPECLPDRRASVHLHLTAEDAWDPARQPAQVSYAVFPEPGARGEGDGFDQNLAQVPPFRGARCSDMGCTDFDLGFDEPGSYQVAVDICGKRFETTVDVELSDDLCHVDAPDIELPVDSSGCVEGEGPTEMEPFDRCGTAEYPSVYAVVGHMVDDVFMPVPVDDVWYYVDERADLDDAGEMPPLGPADELRIHVHDDFCGHDPDKWDDKHDDDDDDDDQGDDDDDDDGGGDDDGDDDDGASNPYPTPDGGPTRRTFSAVCVENPNSESCLAWLAGFEKTGWFTVGVEYCGVTVQKRVFVGKDDENACHVNTQFMMLEVETRDCLATPTKDGGGQRPDEPERPLANPEEDPERPMATPGEDGSDPRGPQELGG